MMEGDDISVDLGSEAAIRAALRALSARVRSHDGERPLHLRFGEGEGEAFTPFSHPVEEVGDPSWEGGGYYPDSGTVFFEAAVAQPALQGEVVALVDDVIAYNRAHRNHPLLQDEETPFGTAALYALTIHDACHVPLYLAFLRTLDLNHEVCESGCIWAVVDKHGWRAETVRLAIVRAMLPGQWGCDQLSGFIDDSGLDDALAAPELEDALVAAMHEELSRERAYPWKLDELEELCHVDAERAPNLARSFARVARER